MEYYLGKLPKPKKFKTLRESGSLSHSRKDENSIPREAVSSIDYTVNSIQEQMGHESKSSRAEL